MKKIYFILLLSTVTITSNAQIVNIPDAKFKIVLLQNGVDTNNDNQIQTSEAEAFTGTIFSYNSNFSDSITDLTGIESFINLTGLSLQNHQLLTTMDLSANTALTFINCNNAQLTGLDLSQNILLETLYCNFNQLNNLNLESNTQLNYLECRNNQLTSLNLSNNVLLQTLYINNNLLTNINLDNLTALEELICSENPLSNLNLVNNENLVFLICKNNSLTNLDVSNNLQLGTIHCGLNQLTSIDVSNNINLDNFECESNQLSDINLGNVNLINFGCSDNLITELDLSNMYDLQTVFISNNPNLTYINFKNGNNDNISISPFSFSNLTNLETVCVDNINSSLVQGIMQYNSQDINFINYCSFVPGGEIYTVTGNTTFDIDNNGCDITDITFPYLTLLITDGLDEGAFLSNNLGIYNMSISEGSHTITPQLENSAYFSVEPTSVIVDFPSDTSPYLQDFCVIANGNFNDLEISVIPLNGAVPGFNADYKIVYKNKGTTTLSGNVNLTFNDDLMDLLTATPTVNSQSSGILLWNYTNLLPFETQEIIFTMSLNSPTDPVHPLNLNDILVYNADINPINEDETTSDNVIEINQVVVNSYDPNNKTCLEGETIALDQVGSYIHYLVRFENNGTSNALNVVVKDVIDTSKYDLFSLVPLNASHQFYTKIRNENEVEFIFENIQLPYDDANNDGYILFKIKTISLLDIGETFTNDAEIYFDYNAPIITNSETTTIQDNLGVDEYDVHNETKLFPNPTSDYFKIDTTSNINIERLELYDISGKILQKFLPSQKYDIDSLESGIYFVKIVTKKTKFIKKLIKL